jgi:3-hydroxyacyl-CoA dehydrogenase
LKKIKHIGIVGEGKMGSSIFLFLLGYDFRLTWLCSSSVVKEKASKQAAKKINILWKSGILTEAAFHKKNEETKITEMPVDLGDCDLVIESISEDLETKKEFFRKLDLVVDQECIFTTNSSSIIPSRLIPSESRQKRFAGLHFFFPVNLKNTVELIHGPDASEETIGILKDFLRLINKNIFLQDEKNAFILNRFLLDFQAEAYNLCANGDIAYFQMDELVKERFFPAGVFEFFDHVGIDVMLASIRNYIENEPDKSLYLPLVARMEELIANNHLGLKTRKGFYNYDLQGRPCNDEEMQKMSPADRLGEIEKQLRNKLERAYRSVLATGYVSAETFDEAVKDYLGTDVDLVRI